MQKIIGIIGPTASGKSSLGERLARECPGEIISCDSVQVYEGFHIGTNKPSNSIQKEIPHHLIDVVGPTDPFHAGRFVELADQAIKEVSGRGRIPLVVGGTGLYLRALLHGLSPAPAIPSGVQETLEKEMMEGGLQPLYEELTERDPELASQLPPTDTQRILRGLAVVRGTGLQLSALNRAHQFSENRYEFRLLAIPHEREVLYERINKRVQEMMEEGLLHEVESLLSQGVPRDCRPMEAPGYSQLVQFMDGKMGLDEAVALIQQSHRRYAKRQMTWLNKTKEVEWVEGESLSIEGLQRWYSSESP